MGETTRHEKWGALSSALFGVTCLSLGAIFVRLADVETLRSAFLRVAYAAPVLFAIDQFRARTDDRDNIPVRKALLVGALLGADLVLLHQTIAILGAGLAVVLANLQVVFVGIGATWIFHERLSPGFWLSIPLVLTGVWLISLGSVSLDPTATLGLGLAIGIASAVLYASYVLGLRWVRAEGVGARTAGLVAWISVGAALTIALPALPAGLAAPAGSWPEDGWLLALALGSQVGGWYPLAAGIHRLPVGATSMILLLNPALAVVWGVVILDEPLGAPRVAGILLVLAAISIAQRGLLLRS